jgi:hypothetical protein
MTTENRTRILKVRGIPKKIKNKGGIFTMMYPYLILLYLTM